MSAQGQAHMAVILHHLAARGHRAECDYGLINLSRRLVLASCGRGEEREGFVAKRLDRPKRFAPDKTQCGYKSVSLGKLNKRGRRHAGASPEIIDGKKRSLGPGGDDGCGMGVGEPLHHAHAKPYSKKTLIIGRL
jgi:hypothetical protein